MAVIMIIRGIPQENIFQTAYYMYTVCVVFSSVILSVAYKNMWFAQSLEWWATGSEKVLAQKENRQPVPLPVDWMQRFSSCALASEWPNLCAW